MNKAVYICTGGCKAEITPERYSQGLTKCGAGDCSKKGVPFEKRLKCETCGEIFPEDQIHQH